MSKKGIYVRFCARASQSSVVRRRRNQVQSVFSGDMCLGKNTAQAANVRAKRVRCSGLHLFEKMPAFLREPVDFVDRLNLPPSRGKVAFAKQMTDEGGLVKWISLFLLFSAPSSAPAGHLPPIRGKVMFISANTNQHTFLEKRDAFKTRFFFPAGKRTVFGIQRKRGSRAG